MTDDEIKPVDIEAAAKMIEKDRKERLEGFQQAIADAAIRYRCDLIAVPEIVGGQIVAFVQAQAK